VGREEHSLSMSENRVLKHAFSSRPKRGNLEEGCKYLNQGWTCFSKI
jgi:hypothetical protein